MDDQSSVGDIDNCAVQLQSGAIVAGTWRLDCQIVIIQHNIDEIIYQYSCHLFQCLQSGVKPYIACKDITIFGFILQFPSLNSALDGPQKAYLKKQFVFITFTFFSRYYHLWENARERLSQWYKEGKLQVCCGTNINKSLLNYNQKAVERQ